mgnify:CR=1 FL=1
MRTLHLNYSNKKGLANFIKKIGVFNFFSIEYDNNLALFITSILLIGILLTIVTMKFSLAQVKFIKEK